jgi:hypothetical protein
MNKLRVKCIQCGKEWTKDTFAAWGPHDISSSLCASCFVKVAAPTIRRKQMREGNFDCFGKADGYCYHIECKYLKWCLHKQEVAETPTAHPALAAA